MEKQKEVVNLYIPSKICIFLNNEESIKANLLCLKIATRKFWLSLGIINFLKSISKLL